MSSRSPTTRSPRFSHTRPQCGQSSRQTVGTPAAGAGHSLGEYSAHAAAGTLSPADAARLVRRRGELMLEAGRQRPGAMAAVLGLAVEAVDQACNEASGPEGIAVAANLNGPDQVVISGDPAAVSKAGDGCKARGAKRVVPLKVSGAFHSPLMAPAVDGLREALARRHVRRSFLSRDRERQRRSGPYRRRCQAPAGRSAHLSGAVDRLHAGGGKPGCPALPSSRSDRGMCSAGCSSGSSPARRRSRSGPLTKWRNSSMAEEVTKDGHRSLRAYRLRHRKHARHRARRRRALHDAGARVAVVGRDAARAKEVASGLGERATGSACDVASESAVATAIAAAETALGPIDILVNNAGLTRDNILLRLRTPIGTPCSTPI